MVWILLFVVCVAVYYMVRFYRLKANLKNAAENLKQIEQNPEENRILLLASPDKEAERFMEALNSYIMGNQRERIFFKNREKTLRAQIEYISHDLRTPLTAIIGYLELMELENLSPEDAETIETVRKKAATLQSLIGNFYDLSRLELNDYHLNMESLDLARFTRENSLLFYQELEKRGLKVEVVTDRKPVPGDAAMQGQLLSEGDGVSDQSPVCVLADTDAMERIFNNMLQNAMRYAESCLRISVYEEGGRACLLFENDTVVLEPKDVPHLFERFYVKEKSRTNQSTGLGLTINKLLAEAMGGSVSAELKGEWLRIGYWFGEAT